MKITTALIREVSAAPFHSLFAYSPLNMPSWTRRILIAVAATAMLNPSARAQILHDGSLGPRILLTGPNYQINAGNGTVRGSNLFHSFAQFNLTRTETATFVSGNGVANIIARITGGQASSIDGRVTTSNSTTSLFLLNPGGIMFGPNATLNVTGAFFASTADYLRFSDNGRFTVDVAQNVTLSISAPAAFGFSRPASASIQVNGSQLVASSGQTLGLIGGDMRFSRSVASALLDAKGGRILLAATRGIGEAAFGGNGTIDTSSFTRMGDLTMQDGTIVRVSEGTARTGSGTVYIRAGNFVLDHSSIDASTTFGNAGGIDLEARNALLLSGGKLTAVTTGGGNAGTIALVATDITFAPGSSADTSCNTGCTTGNGGNISMVAANELTITGDAFGGQAFVVSNTFGGGNAGSLELAANQFSLSGIAFLQTVTRLSGTAGNIAIRAKDVRIDGGAQIDVSTRSIGRGGNLRIDATHGVIINGTRTNPANANLLLPTALIANADSRGNAGTIFITANDLAVTGGARISSRAAAAGRGGDVMIRTSGGTLVAGRDSLGGSSAIIANTLGSGDAGTIEIVTPNLRVLDYGVIQSQSEGLGNGNRISLRGGDITIGARGQISSDARSTGAGGSIIIDIDGVLSISGPNTGLFAKTYGPGMGGAVSIKADTVLLTNLGGVFATTDGAGAGGKIDIARTKKVVITGNARIASESTATGTAGDIAIDADSITISGDGGVATAATFADGGNIYISAIDRIVVTKAQITTAVGDGAGNGGNIKMDTPLLLLREGSAVTANAFGGGGGNIDAKIRTLMRSGDSSITASSRFGLDGTILLSSPAVELTRDLVALEPNYLDIGAILAGRCSTRLAGRASSLAVNTVRVFDKHPSDLFLGFTRQHATEVKAKRDGMDADLIDGMCLAASGVIRAAREHHTVGTDAR